MPLAIGSVDHISRAQVPCGVTRMAITVPRAPSPPWGVTPPRVVCPRPRPALPGPLRYDGLMRQTSTLSRPTLCGLVRESLQVAVCPLLGRGPSRCYLLNLCGGAWTRTPPRLCGALTRFFPQSFGLTSRATGSARDTTAMIATAMTNRFRGCSHSLMFRLPHLLGPQIAPTVEAHSLLGSRAVYATQRTYGYPSRTVVSLRA